MEKLTVEITYGHALFNAFSELHELYLINDEYKALSRIFEEHPQLKKLFCVPTVTVKEKKEVAEKIFGGLITPELLNFIFILIDKHRMGSWERIGREYEQLLWDREHHAKGIIYSVVPLDEERLKAFEFKTDVTINKRVKLENRIDETLIGGVKIYVDGRLIDASVKARLASMKQRIKQ